MGEREDPVLGSDASAVWAESSVAEYADDIHAVYKVLEKKRRPGDYMSSQVNINAGMRAILADWLIGVHESFRLRPETLYLTFYILDRYLSMEKEAVRRENLQLVGATAMLIAGKYEEVWHPDVVDLVVVTDCAYTREEMLHMEAGILKRLGWNLSVPTAFVFLVRFAAASDDSDREMEQMSFFFAEMGLMCYSLVKCSPSLYAASAVYAARCTLRKSSLWNETLERDTGYSEQQLLDCAHTLLRCHYHAQEGALTIVYQKYLKPQHGAVALHPPALLPVNKLKADLAIDC